MFVRQRTFSFANFFFHFMQGKAMGMRGDSNNTGSECML